MSAPATSSTVEVIGRLGAHVRTRDLPSGDTVATFTVVVDRPIRERHGNARVDAIACVATSKKVRAHVERWEPGTMVQVCGVLRRRFWRAGGASGSGNSLGSSTEVLVRTARRA